MLQNLLQKLYVKQTKISQRFADDSEVEVCDLKKNQIIQSR